MKWIRILFVIMLPACQSMKRESVALKTARAELLNVEWQRKAVYGISENQGPRMKIRRVYISERECNGVRIPGSIQAVGVSEDP